MRKLEDDIYLAQCQISDLYLGENKETIEAYFDHLYHFTTEMINGYYKLLSFKGKKILTVMGSGDHTLNAILKGSRNIDTFDINPLAIYYYKLKEAAIKGLEYNEFCEFFYPCKLETINRNPKIWNHKIYLKFSPYLEPLYKKFWDSMYLEFSGEEIRNSKLFWEDNIMQTRLHRYNSYLTKNGYYLLKNILLNQKVKINFYNKNISNLELKQKYDYMFLSNISQYLNKIYKKDELEQFNELIKKLANSLNPNGILFHSYLYDYSYHINKKISISKLGKIYDLEMMKQKIQNLEVIEIPAYGLTKTTDAVYVYKK